VKASNDSIQQALFSLGTAYLNEIEDLPSAIATFEELRRRFPKSEKDDEVLFNLFYAYGKTGNTSTAAAAKRLLTGDYPASRFTAIVSTGKDPVAKSNVPTQESTKAYENVYNLFIEGRFNDAITSKRIADSTYKTTFWQPQLLYIESVYYIKQRQDSVAKNVLETIIRQNSNQALTAKAQNLVSVLDRRQQIEDELTRLQITRPSEDDTAATQPVAVVVPPSRTPLPL
jgi:outer membrane protein assembly factor BamD (BamD/ComL family)